MLKVYLNGEYFTKTDAPENLFALAQEFGLNGADLTISSDDLEVYQMLQIREQVRAEITPLAGDVQSIQGTIADNVGLLLEELGRFMSAATDSSDAVIAAAAQPLANALAPLVAAVDSNAYKLTHHVKGSAQVVADAYTRSNAVAAVLESHANPE